MVTTTKGSGVHVTSIATDTLGGRVAVDLMGAFEEATEGRGIARTKRNLAIRVAIADLRRDIGKARFLIEGCIGGSPRSRPQP
jgi:hypothetical protein